MTLTRESITARVKAEISEQMGMDEADVALDRPLGGPGGMGFDSLDKVKLLMALEDAYEIEIAEKEFQKWKTPEDAIEYLCKTLAVSA